MLKIQNKCVRVGSLKNCEKEKNSIENLQRGKENIALSQKNHSDIFMLKKELKRIEFTIYQTKVKLSQIKENTLNLDLEKTKTQLIRNNQQLTYQLQESDQIIELKQLMERQKNILNTLEQNNKKNRLSLLHEQYDLFSTEQQNQYHKSKQFNEKSQNLLKNGIQERRKNKSLYIKMDSSGYLQNQHKIRQYYPAQKFSLIDQSVSSNEKDVTLFSGITRYSNPNLFGSKMRTQSLKDRDSSNKRLIQNDRHVLYGNSYLQNLLKSYQISKLDKPIVFKAQDRINISLNKLRDKLETVKQSNQSFLDDCINFTCVNC